MGEGTHNIEKYFLLLNWVNVAFEDFLFIFNLAMPSLSDSVSYLIYCHHNGILVCSRVLGLTEYEIPSRKGSQMVCEWQEAGTTGTASQSHP